MAIVFDAKANSAGQSSVASTTLSLTIGASLSNSILVVAVCIRNDFINSNFATSTGVTWNGTAMTLAKRQNGPTASKWLTAELWYLVAPASGAHDIVATYSETVNQAAIAGISFQGVNQSSPIDATAGRAIAIGDEASVFETAITTVANNAWLVNAIWNSLDAAMSPTQGETSWFNVTSLFANDQIGGAYKGPLTPAGSQTTGWTGNIGDEAALAVLSLTPALAVLTGAKTIAAFASTAVLKAIAQLTGVKTIAAVTSAGAMSGFILSTLTGAATLAAVTSVGALKNIIQLAGAGVVAAVTSVGALKNIIQMTGAKTLPAVTSSGAVTAPAALSGSTTVANMVSSGVLTDGGAPAAANSDWLSQARQRGRR